MGGEEGTNDEERTNDEEGTNDEENFLVSVMRVGWDGNWDADLGAGFANGFNGKLDGDPLYPAVGLDTS